jgi:hypothetical protein
MNNKYLPDENLFNSKCNRIKRIQTRVMQEHAVNAAKQFV